MQPKMSDEQRDFFRSLQAEFDPGEVKARTQAGRTFHYVTGRTVQNRLDEVCTPSGWRVAYVATAKGFISTIFIKVPDEEGEWHWLDKSDGGGFAGMSDQDSDQKSGFSDAFKRAAVAWGIGRYLYKDGMPDYLGDEPAAPAGSPAGQSQAPAPAKSPAVRPGGGGGPITPGRPAAPPASAPGRPPGGAGGPAAGRGRYDQTKPPVKGGKNLYAWAKSQDGIIGAGMLNLLADLGAEFGYGTDTREWSDEQAVYCAWTAIHRIRSAEVPWSGYEGQYDHLVDPFAGSR